MEVVGQGEDGGAELEGHPVRGDEAHERHDDDEVRVDPVDVLPPVAPRHGRLRDVWLLGIEGTPGPHGDVVSRPVGDGGVDAR